MRYVITSSAEKVKAVLGNWPAFGIGNPGVPDTLDDYEEVNK